MTEFGGVQQVGPGVECPMSAARGKLDIDVSCNHLSGFVMRLV